MKKDAEQMSIKMCEKNYCFLPLLHVVLGVVNLVVTLLALADISSTAFLADLVFCLT